ncbi:MAG: helical backbone metal receptor [candidate division WOR-3 bacterium]
MLRVCRGRPLCLPWFIPGLITLLLAPISCQKGSGNAKKPTLVSLNPAATEMIFALSAEDHLLAVSDFCDWPPEAQNLPKVGDLIKPNLEKIARLRPDYVIVFLPTQARLADDISKIGLKTLDVSPETGDEVLLEIEDLARVLGVEERARTLADSLRSELSGIEKPANSPSVFIELGINPLYTAGAGTFPDDLVRLAGGTNVFSDTRGYFPVQEEEVLKRRPEVIVLAHEEGPSPGGRMGWKGLDARVVRVDSDLITRPGPRFVQGVKALAEGFGP